MRAVSFWFVCASLQRQQCSYCQSDLVHIYSHACCHTYLLVCTLEKLGISQLTFGIGMLDIARDAPFYLDIAPHAPIYPLHQPLPKLNLREYTNRQKNRSVREEEGDGGRERKRVRERQSYDSKEKLAHTQS
jgi:hypothetical protein